MSSTRFYKQGQRLAQQGKYGQAIECFEQALALNSSDANTLFALGNVAKKIGLLEIAEKMFRATLVHVPNSIEAASNLGNLLTGCDRIDEAIDVFQTILAEHPEDAATWLNIGVAVKKSGDLEKSEIFTREAMRIKPRYAEAHVNLSEILAANGDISGASNEINKAWKLNKGNGKIRYNRSEFLLLNGDLKEGWREMNYGLSKYEGRITNYHHKLKLWNGENLEGKSILLSGDQGLGDQIRYINCIPDIIKKADRVVIETEKRLVDLMAHTFPTAEVHAIDCDRIADQWHFNYNWPVGELNYASPMLNLFKFCRNSIEDFPEKGVPIITDPKKQAHWKKRVADKSKCLKIGLCWRGGISNLMRDMHAINIMDMGPILSLKGVSFFSLMYAECEQERQAVKEKFGVDIISFEDLDYKNDMDNIFALSKEMDVMVSCTSTPFSITAAVEVPTYLMLPTPSWLSFGTNSMPMEPAVTAYMPQKLGDWSDVIEKIAADIQAKYL